MNKKYIMIVLLITVCLSGCEKFLDAKPNQNDVIPSTLVDLQALLDDYVNTQFDPTDAEVSAGDYYLTDQHWAGLNNETDRRMYLWEKDDLFTSPAGDWKRLYQTIYSANVVLEQNTMIDRNVVSKYDWDNIRGQALFLRARSFLCAAIIWTNGYDESTASNELGLPLRITPDFNIPSTRSNLKETYNQIISDLKQAAYLLPVNSIHVTRPSKPAALGLLARTYLLMRDYKNCYHYANEYLLLKNDLIDYNTLNSKDAFPMRLFNKEVVYNCFMPVPQPLNMTRAKIDPELYKDYADGDLRKVLFFKPGTNGSYAFKGSYQGNSSFFSGIATDEVYLMRAECYARAGDIPAALADMNTLLKNRWAKSMFIPVTSDNIDEITTLILKERRKELLMRNIRWADIKRLNKEGAGIILKRVINDETHVLPPNDLRFALPIPEDIIHISGMRQNPR